MEFATPISFDQIINIPGVEDPVHSAIDVQLKTNRPQLVIETDSTPYILVPSGLNFAYSFSSIAGGSGKFTMQELNSNNRARVPQSYEEMIRAVQDNFYKRLTNALTKIGNYKGSKWDELIPSDGKPFRDFTEADQMKLAIIINDSLRDKKTTGYPIFQSGSKSFRIKVGDNRSLVIEWDLDSKDANDGPSNIKLLKAN